MNICKRARKVLRWLAEVIDEKMENSVAVALQVTTVLIDLLNKPIMHNLDLLVTITPTKLDDEGLKKFKVVLSIALARLTDAKQCEQFDKLEDRLACYFTAMHGKSKEVKDAQMIKLAAIFAKIWDESRYAQRVYDTVTQVAVMESKLN